MTGKLVQHILGRFESNPHGAWTTSELITEAYSNRREEPTKAQRVAMLRAMKRATELHPELALEKGSTPDSEVIIYRAVDEKSYVERCNRENPKHWRRQEDREWNGKPVHWVEVAKAKLADDQKRLHELEEEHRQAMDALTGKMDAILGRPHDPTSEELRQQIGALAFKLLKMEPDQNTYIWVDSDNDKKPLFKLIRVKE